MKQRPPLRRTWWLVLLLNGARARSGCRLEWRDIDFEAGLTHFRVVKRGGPYTVPMADRLPPVLEEYRELRLGRATGCFRVRSGQERRCSTGETASRRWLECRRTG